MWLVATVLHSTDIKHFHKVLCEYCYYGAMRKNALQLQVITWVNSTNVILSEINQIQKNIYCMLLLTQSSKTHKNNLCYEKSGWWSPFRGWKYKPEGSMRRPLNLWSFWFRSTDTDANVFTVVKYMDSIMMMCVLFCIQKFPRKTDRPRRKQS